MGRGCAVTQKGGGSARALRGTGARRWASQGSPRTVGRCCFGAVSPGPGPGHWQQRVSGRVSHLSCGWGGGGEGGGSRSKFLPQGRVGRPPLPWPSAVSRPSACVCLFLPADLGLSEPGSPHGCLSCSLPPVLLQRDPGCHGNTAAGTRWWLGAGSRAAAAASAISSARHLQGAVAGPHLRGPRGLPRPRRLLGQ